ncbi:cobaltochelatase subunit CobN [uncultured Ilyobacter sp.]|uniref:cobaltochelatase subunit CobN n=1 Tax=uncultured Ilyobacter sp. TaxID=544433 RepID=UPI0029C66A7F|nr:cobaltochelatase subunit CobN [uncultured Ilyobacter sp.]
MFNALFILSSHDPSYVYRAAWNQIEKSFPGEIQLNFADPYKIDDSNENYESFKKQAEEADFIFIIMHSGITYFKRFEKLMGDFEGKKKFFIYSGNDEENIELFKRSGVSSIDYQEIVTYYLMGGVDNCENMLLYIANEFAKGKYPIQPPIAPSWEGVYYPGKEIIDSQEYIENLKKLGKPIVGILVYRKYYQENNLEHIDALIHDVEKLGGEPLAIYTSSSPNPTIGCKGFKWTLENLLMNDGKPNVDVVINTMSYAQSIMSNPGDGKTTVEESIFESLGVAIIQAMCTYFTLEAWEESICGLDMMSLSSSVYYPEFDGQIISVPIGYHATVEDEIGEKWIFRPIEERVDKVCRLALNWGKLKRMSNENKKVAILFHNMPPRNDMIGCAYGLDTPASVYNMVEDLKIEGVKTDYDFQNGDEIIKRIIEAVTNDTRWVSPEEAIKKSVDIIEGDTYRSWFADLGEPVQKKMQEDWGTPPGEFMVHEDKLPVPGIINGNIFIGLQPARGYEEKAEEIYHSTDIMPPHQYIAFYRWIKYGFKADVIVHVGTHGTIEWLPGKQIGLSGNCYSDICIDDLPHLYPYSINVVGEGIQAKRRSYCVILDHLIPSLMPSGTYDEMVEMDELIKQYFQAKQEKLDKVKYLQEDIKALLVKNNFDKDLNITEDDMNRDFENIMDRVHGWLEDIKHTLIKDGLHYFGKVPEGERLNNLVAALVRIPNKDIPSVTGAVAKLKGLDHDYLKDEPLQKDETGKTNLMLLDDIEAESRKVLTKFHENNYREDFIPELLAEKYPAATEEEIEDLSKTLKFISQTVIPKLSQTTDELKYFIEGTNGRFVPPGDSGCPTRGNVSILPTGRNFYSIDPSSIPTRASWKVGIQLGDDLIKRYIKDEGKYPENVAIIVYAGQTMKTSGDDISEILYLMGIRPKWLKNTDKVVGLEVIPMEELKRPRIDVILRISGLFRDTFPNIIEIVEDAVNLAASLDESEEDNYIKKNIMSEIQELVKDGINFEDAEEQARMRIFGCPPGTYGTGVDILINSKNWKDVGDLGNTYTLWGGHAYGRKLQGKKVREVFGRRLANADVAVKNESSMEVDLLDSDDFYNYHGGLIAAIRTHSGKKPRAYCGDTSDPDRTKLNSVDEQIAKIMRARVLNPKWFEGLKEHGYKGAQEVAAMMDFVFGWDATSDVVEDWMYSKINETFLLDEEKRKWLEDVNHWAVHSMSERLLEAYQRGMWNAGDEELEKLREIYLETEANIEDIL